MPKIRVLRLLEYTYDSVENMQRDMAKWAVQGTHQISPTYGIASIVIKSTTLPIEVLDEPSGKSFGLIKPIVPIGLYVDTESRTVLLQKRTLHEEFKDTWELPGGKMMPGETAQEALAREWKEELNVIVVVGDFLGQAEFPKVDLHLFRVDSIDSLHDPKGEEPIDWFRSADLDALPMAPGLIKFLPIVRRYL